MIAISTARKEGEEEALNPTVAWFLIVWMGLQVILLYSQEVLGPRWFIPKRYLPQKYDYRRPLPPAVLESAMEEEEEDEFGLEGDKGEEREGGTSNRRRREEGGDEGGGGGGLGAENNNNNNDDDDDDDREHTSNHAIDSNNNNNINNNNSSSSSGSAPRTSLMQQAMSTFRRHVPVRVRRALGIDRRHEGHSSYELVELGGKSSTRGEGRGAEGGGGGGGGGGEAGERAATLDCVICLTPVTLTGRNADYYLSPCDHVFHPECLAQWMEQKMECPTCRQPLPRM